ncbi:MAG: hypothetical protein DWQ04_18885 [Chloroflexi bacterium]|nr:MAG: hypothetical protein DWQ04_18885 [Chloroflexota bacterium]
MITSLQKQKSDFSWSFPSLYKIGGIAAFLQLASILTLAIAMAVLGPKPTSAEAYFMVQQSSKITAVLRGDFLLLILIGLYLGTFPAMVVALRHINPVYTALAMLFTIIAVTGTFATESTFALLHLGDLYAAAATDVARAQFLAAGEAVIAADMWHSSAAYMGGILLQGSGVIISLIMLRSKDFSKVTAYAGLIGNALDLIQHLLHPFAPSISAPIQSFMGVFYLVWFPMLGWDLLKLSRNQKVTQS